MALVTAAEVRARGLRVNGTSDDTKIEHVIAATEAWIARYIALPVYDSSTTPSWEDQTYTLYLDGDGGDVLQLPVRPLVSVTSIYSDAGRQYAASSLVDSGDYTTNLPKGQVILDWDSNLASWPKWQERAIKATVVAGWATVPEWLKQCVADIVVAMWAGRQGAAGKSSKSGRGGSVTFREDLIPPHVYPLLAEYQPPAFG